LVCGGKSVGIKLRIPREAFALNWSQMRGPRATPSANRRQSRTDTKGDIRTPKFWYAPEANTIFDMFKEVGLEKQYNEGYRPLSGVEHSDAMAFYAMVGDPERSENRRKLAIQSDLFIPAYLRNAFQY